MITEAAAACLSTFAVRKENSSNMTLEVAQGVRVRIVQGLARLLAYLLLSSD